MGGSVLHGEVEYYYGKVLPNVGFRHLMLILMISEVWWYANWKTIEVVPIVDTLPC
jgi:hypothetical protein